MHSITLHYICVILLTGRWSSDCSQCFSYYVGQAALQNYMHVLFVLPLAMLKDGLQSGHNGCFMLPSYSHLLSYTQILWAMHGSYRHSFSNSIHNKELLNWTFKPSHLHTLTVWLVKIYRQKSFLTTDQHYCILTLYENTPPVDKVHATAQYILTICGLWQTSVW